MIIKDLLKNSPIEKHINQQLLLAILQKNRSFLISHDDYSLNDNELQRYQNAVKELQNGKPLAYILGVQAFWKHDFLVNEHTLIPRPDTEILIETVLNFIKNSLSKKEYLSILDLGTGTGCIAISLAFENPNAHVIAIDFSENALKIAEQNAKRAGVNVNFLCGSWFEPLQHLKNQQKFDIIVSNPPYIDPKDPHLTNLTYEPITALVAKNHGLADIEHIVSHTKNHLNPQGLLAIEHGYDQAKQVQSIVSNHHFNQIQTIKDYGDNDRVTCGIFDGNF